MLDPWIIEEIQKREERQRRSEQPALEIPVERPEESDQSVHEEDDVERGVIIVDFSV